MGQNLQSHALLLFNAGSSDRLTAGRFSWRPYHRRDDKTWRRLWQVLAPMGAFQSWHVAEKPMTWQARKQVGCGAEEISSFSCLKRKYSSPYTCWGRSDAPNWKPIGRRQCWPWAEEDISILRRHRPCRACKISYCGKRTNMRANEDTEASAYSSSPRLRHSQAYMLMAAIIYSCLAFQSTPLTCFGHPYDHLPWHWELHADFFRCL